MAYYRNDPRWLFARYSGTCRKCEGRIRKGDRAWYYPKGKHIYCEPCGEPQAREFESAVADEDFYNSRY